MTTPIRPCGGDTIPRHGSTRLILNRCWVWAVLVVSALYGPATGAQTPDDREDEMFGVERNQEPVRPPSDPPPPANAIPNAGLTRPFDSESTESEVFSGKIPETSAISLSNLVSLNEDILQIGGQIYLRSMYSISEDTSFSDQRFAMPNLLDVYFDARPNDRVRGFVRGRLKYDPTSDGTTTQVYRATGDNPDAILDQLWLKFDISRSVYATVGKQPLKWGAARFWNPADIVYTQRRDPLTLFDERTGLTLLKLHVPIESLGWNFYAVGLFDGAASLADVGGAFRGEFVFESIELGVSTTVRDGVKTKFAVDVSAGVLDVDLYAETSISLGMDRPSIKVPDGVDVELAEQMIGLVEELVKPPGVDEDDTVVRIAAGFTYGIRYSDEDSLYIGGEYFFNPAGYDDKALYPLLYAVGIAQPLYLGKHYGALYISLPQPGSWDDATFTLSTVGNFSDLSFLVRADFSVRVLTYLNIEAYAAGHVGTNGGELRFSTDAVELPTGDTIPALAAPILDVGINLRLSI